MENIIRFIFLLLFPSSKQWNKEKHEFVLVYKVITLSVQRIFTNYIRGVQASTSMEN